MNPLPPTNPSGPVRFAFIEMTSDDKAKFIFSTEKIETRKLDEDESDEIFLPLDVEEIPLDIQSRDGKDGIVLYKDNLSRPYSSTLTNQDGSRQTTQRNMIETKTREVTVFDIDEKKMVRYSVRTPKMKPVMVTRANSDVTTTRESLQTVYELETHTKIIRRDEKLVRVLEPTQRITKFSSLSFSNVTGQNKSNDEVAQACQQSKTNRMPIVLVAPGHSLPEYFELILAPETLVVEDPFWT